MFLYNFQDIIISGYRLEWVAVLSFLCVLVGVLTIICKNPILSILFLITLFVFISVYLIIQSIAFIGISYLLVYVGAISILFLFILMLINVRISELLTEGRNSSVLAILVTLAFGFAFLNKIPYVIDLYSDLLNIQSVYLAYMHKLTNLDMWNHLELNGNISSVSSSNWDNSLMEVTHIASIGNLLYTIYLVNMGILGNILLLAMVGAIVITVKMKDKFNDLNPFAKDYVMKPDINLNIKK